MTTIEELNGLSEAKFIAALDGVYDAAPWIAKDAFNMGPHDDADALRECLRGVVDHAIPAQQVSLIETYPDLWERVGQRGFTTGGSPRLRSRLGLDDLSDAELERFERKHSAYRECFEMPFVLCDDLIADRDSVMSALEKRLNNEPRAEQLEALRQIHLIADLRLQELGL